MLLTYPAMIHTEDGVFWAEFPDLEGCFTQGDSMAEIMHNCEESLEAYVTTRLDLGEDLPTSSDMATFTDVPATTKMMTVSIEV